MITVLMLGLMAGGCFVYMKFYLPKLKQKGLENYEESQKEWVDKKEDIIKDYLTNPNKFGLISKNVEEGEKVIGIVSTNSPKKSTKSKVLSGLKSAITLTEKVDMSLYYLFITEKNLYYAGFDGENCFFNEVFDSNLITDKVSSDNSFTFKYKEEELNFKVSLSSPGGALNGYPRFNVHEKSRIPTKDDRSKNYFVREFLDIEPTNNVDFKGNNFGAMSGMSAESLLDVKVREYLATEFKNKLKLA